MLKTGKPYVYGAAAEKIEYNVYEENKVLKSKRQQKSNNKAKFKTVVTLFVVFVMFFVIIYRYALLTEINYNIAKVNKSYTEIKNDNIRLKISIENETDLNKIKTIAEEKLGMHKPDKYQIVYVKVPKSDFNKISEGFKDTGIHKENIFTAIEKGINKFYHLLY